MTDTSSPATHHLMIMAYGGPGELVSPELAACVVATDQPHANSVLSAADRLVEAEYRARIVDSYTTYY